MSASGTTTAAASVAMTIQCRFTRLPVPEACPVVVVTWRSVMRHLLDIRYVPYRNVILLLRQRPSWPPSGQAGWQPRDRGARRSAGRLGGCARSPCSGRLAPDRHWLRLTGTTAAQQEETPQVVQPGPDESLPFAVLWSCRILVRWDRQLIPSGGRSSPLRAAACCHAVRG